MKIRAQEGLYQTIIDAIVMGPAEVETHEMEEVLGIRSEDFLKSKFKRNVPAKLSESIQKLNSYESIVLNVLDGKGTRLVCSSLLSRMLVQF